MKGSGQAAVCMPTAGCRRSSSLAPGWQDRRAISPRRTSSTAPQGRKAPGVGGSTWQSVVVDTGDQGVPGTATGRTALASNILGGSTRRTWSAPSTSVRSSGRCSAKELADLGCSNCRTGQMPRTRRPRRFSGGSTDRTGTRTQLLVERGTAAAFGAKGPQQRLRIRCSAVARSGLRRWRWRWWSVKWRRRRWWRRRLSMGADHHG